MDADNLIQKAPLAVLISRCQQEDDLFRQKLQVNPAHCFEIWRRAFQLRDERACDAVVTLYYRYAQVWVQGFLKKALASSIEEDFLVNGAFIRIFRYITPERFKQFPHLATLMNYLKACCRGVVSDYLRQFKHDYYQESLDENPAKVEAAMPQGATEIISQQEFIEFWRLVKRTLNELEQRAIFARYIEGMSPLDIVKTYPAFFLDIDAVRRTLKNALWKLRHDPKLAWWFKGLED